MSHNLTPPYRHDSLPLTGILAVNLGTPDAPEPAALRRYLGEFLWDPRLVELPRPLWWLILHGIILRTRPKRSAAAYRKIWSEHGSPLLHITRQQAQALTDSLAQHFSGPFRVAPAMRYGEPSIPRVLGELREAGLRRLLVLPLYPQYAAATTASVFDAVTQTLQGWRWLPEVRFVNHYHDHPGYIRALATQINAYWQQHSRPDHLLFSFHGIPQRAFLAGDPYPCECRKTARLVAEHLALPPDTWQVTFQSRFGREPWLQPYTDHTLTALGAAGGRVDVVCPGFAADCLETLEEIAVENRRLFLEAGGKAFHYIPALNAAPAHIAALTDIVLQHTPGWPECRTPTADLLDMARASAQRAQQNGG